ncbi:MAG: YncE family protein [Bacteroidales bacterium]|nr:YncE family protein [Bacteroidales bacterium]
MKAIGTWMAALALLATAISSCRKELQIVPPTDTPVTDASFGKVTGFYLLNEGNMGSNKATLDFFDYTTGIYAKNIFASANPFVARELGDVGNDLQIYGKKLYAVINCSNLVEVMDSRDAKHIAQISIPNCRYITFDKGYAYVSSYAGPVEMDPNSRKGYVAKIDTASLQIVAECTVGYQPEEMVVENGKLYVANSGGYRVPNYDNTVSVIDLATFQVIKTISVEINLHRMEKDRFGNIYVSSRGDGYDIPPQTFVISSATDELTDMLELLPVSDMAMSGDSLYVVCSRWNNFTNSNEISYAIYDVIHREIVSRHLITDGTDEEIQIPYGIAVNPETKEFFITDAKDYVTPGTLYCFGKDGVRKWQVTTGDIPAHIAFVAE